MRKVLLFSLFICCGFCFVSAAMAVGIQTCDGKTSCRQYQTGDTIETNNCVGKNVNDDCSSTGATAAKCFMNKNHGVEKMSCAAKKCDPQHILWLTNTRTPSPQSQGLCMNRASLESWCSKGCGCEKDEECKLNVVSFSNPGYGMMDAFVGEEACVCVKKESATVPVVTTGGDCVYTFKADIQCKSGKSWHKDQKINLKKSEIDNLSCDDLKAKIDKDIDFAKKYFEQLCAVEEARELRRSEITDISLNDAPSDTEIRAAEEALSAFFGSVDVNKSVWKTAEGKFNTARLASDLTAGVVLGTVGGVVSGVVIKKNQVKKGFEVLHCSVGGQTVAGWGDEFNVGLRR